jgi:hypothetical protein
MMFLSDGNTENQANIVKGLIDADVAASYESGTKIGTAFSQGVTDNLLKGNVGSIAAWISGQTAALFAPSEIYKRTRILDEQSTQIRNSLGLGIERGREFELMVADNASRFAELGMGVTDVSKTFNALAGEYETTVTISNEQLTELAATARVTGQNVGTLAEKFRDVGISIVNVGDTMEGVVEIARSAGVSVAAVSAGVVSNLEKMNIYNFEGGIKGLAKMSAQAARLGVDMTKIFTIVDKVFNPEGAIELAASLQRLGVSANALLDPLRLMDLSQNDPAELQNQIIEMSKDFVRFNKELGQFEILPGEKRRLNEIGKELGYANGELQQMALHAAEFDMKLKQIKFPEGIASKEDRELIATMATINKEGIAEVKVKQMDETGNWTGEYEIVEASQLTAEQITRLKDEQKGQAKTMEELAREQLNQTERLNAKFDEFFKAVGYGLSSSQMAKGVYDLSTTSLRELLFRDKETDTGLIGGEYVRTRTYRQGTDVVAGEMKDFIKETLENYGISGFGDIINKIKDIDFSSMLGGLSNLGNLTNFDFSTITDTLGNLLGSGIGGLTNLFGIGGSETDPLSNFNTNTETFNNTIQTFTNQITSIKEMGKIEFKPLEINENVKIDLNVKLDPDSKNQALTELMTKALTEYFEGGNNTTNINMVLDQLNKLKTGNGLIPAGSGGQYTISAPGKPQ